MLNPFPARGGPSKVIESSTLAQHPSPRLDPNSRPTSAGWGRAWTTEGRSVAARRNSAFSPAGVADLAAVREPFDPLGVIGGVGSGGDATTSTPRTPYRQGGRG